MEGSLDDLIRYLLEEIALCGDQGTPHVRFCSVDSSSITLSRVQISRPRKFRFMHVSSRCLFAIFRDTLDVFSSLGSIVVGDLISSRLCVDDKFVVVLLQEVILTTNDKQERSLLTY